MYIDYHTKPLKQTPKKIQDKMTLTLDLLRNRDHLHIGVYQCTKFEVHWFKHSQERSFKPFRSLGVLDFGNILKNIQVHVSKWH